MYSGSARHLLLVATSSAKHAGSDHRRRCDSHAAAQGAEDQPASLCQALHNLVQTFFFHSHPLSIVITTTHYTEWKCWAPGKFK